MCTDTGQPNYSRKGCARGSKSVVCKIKKPQGLRWTYRFIRQVTTFEMCKDQRHGFLTSQSDKSCCTALRSSCWELLRRCGARGRQRALGGVWYTSMFFTLHSLTMASCSDRRFEKWKNGPRSQSHKFQCTYRYF